MSFSNGAHLGLLAQACANGHHTVHAGLGRPCDDLVQLALKIWKIKMAMAVGQFWRLDHERPFSRKILDAVSSIFNPISKISELGSRFAVLPCLALWLSSSWASAQIRAAAGPGQRRAKTSASPRAAS